MKRKLLLAVFMLSANLSFAQHHLNDIQKVNQHSETVVGLFENYEFEEAFSELQQYWPIPENEISQLESQTIKQFNFAADRFGKIIGSDFLKDQEIMDFALQKTYLLRFEKHMIRIKFTYYRSDEGWILNRFTWDDKFHEEF